MVTSNAAEATRRPALLRASDGAHPRPASPEPRRREGRGGGFLATLVPALLVLAGLCALFYPTAANWLADMHHAEAVADYDETTAAMDEQQRAAMLEAAEQYNESLAGDPVRDPFMPGSGYAIPGNYNDVLNPNGDGVMGSIQIPKIGVNLPIYHGTGEKELSKGVGHIPSTPLPIGGTNRHSVLTGHRGLPSAELFTRLDELGAGDIVLVDIAGETHAYKVYATEVVLPDDLSSLAAEKDRDLLTLVTCTPYGVNTHRLLVHCERTDYVPAEADAQKGTGKIGIDTIARAGGAALGLLLLLGIGIGRIRRARKAGRAAGSRGAGDAGASPSFSANNPYAMPAGRGFHGSRARGRHAR